METLIHFETSFENSVSRNVSLHHHFLTLMKRRKSRNVRKTFSIFSARTNICLTCFICLTWITAVQFKPHRYITVPCDWMNSNVSSYDWFVQWFHNDALVIRVGDIFLQRDVHMQCAILIKWDEHYLHPWDECEKWVLVCHDRRRALRRSVNMQKKNWCFYFDG